MSKQGGINLGRIEEHEKWPGGHYELIRDDLVIGGRKKWRWLSREQGKIRIEVVARLCEQKNRQKWNKRAYSCDGKPEGQEHNDRCLANCDEASPRYSAPTLWAHLGRYLVPRTPNATFLILLLNIDLINCTVHTMPRILTKK